MVMNGWFLSAASAAAAALLVNAGVAKLVAPGALARALAEAMPRAAGEPTAIAVRIFALAELLVGLALLVPAARRGAAVAVVAMGGLFAAFGMIGIARRSTIPCGCLGGTARHPLGVFNIAFGLALLLIGAIQLVSAWPSRPGTSAAILLAAIGILCLCLWLHRRLIAELVLHRETSQLETGAIPAGQL
jgi:uncharacterized membrane protein